MNNLGLVSITFRQHSVEEIIEACKKAKLSQIEWGSDVHVPQTDLENAKRVGELTRAAGMEVSSYGSYYYLTKNENYESVFKEYLEAAKALGTSIIRIWGGGRGSADADAAYRAQCVSEAQVVCDMAKEYGITVAFEYHRGTLTDTCDSALQFMEEINRENCKLYWQPGFHYPNEVNLDAVKRVLPYLSIVHAFVWSDKGERLSMHDGIDLWKEYMEVFEAGGVHTKYLLEFVIDNDLSILSREAEGLKAAAVKAGAYQE